MTGPSPSPLRPHRPTPLVLTPLLGIPEVRPGDDLAALIREALAANGVELADGDILVVSSKVVSKALGLTAPAGRRADVVAQQSRRVVAERQTPGGVTRVVAAVSGPVMAGAGVDASNTGGAPTSSGDSAVLLLPADPDACARDLLAGLTGALASAGALDGRPRLRLGVVVSDTAGRAWRVGQTDFALGAAGVAVLDDLRGVRDADGVALQVTMRAVADEVAAAADLVKGKVDAVPVAHVRGLGGYVLPADAVVVTDDATGGAADLLRGDESDWFALGHLEAVRAALGVEPGSALSERLGIASVLPEPVIAHARRALGVALHGLSALGGPVSGELTLTGIRLRSSDLFVLGAAAARLLVALSGEGIDARLDAPWRPATVDVSQGAQHEAHVSFGY